MSAFKRLLRGIWLFFEPAFDWLGNVFGPSLKSLAEWALSPEEWIGRLRRNVTILFVAFGWVGLAYLTAISRGDVITIHPEAFQLHARFVTYALRSVIVPDEGYPAAGAVNDRFKFFQNRSLGLTIVEDIDPHLFATPLTNLFAAGIFQHVVIVLLTFWGAYRLAATYLDDVFELGDVSITERFILQSVFGNRYETLVIKDGEVAPQCRDLPVNKIGGPGYVSVFLENAALFERPHGGHRVIPPTRTGGRRERVMLNYFESLRKVIDLRDHARTFDTWGRTRDGIKIKASNIRAVFSVARNPQAGSDPKVPYTFTDQAIENLVYERSDSPWPQEMGVKISVEFRELFARNTLGELLAAISQVDVDDLQALVNQVQTQANTQSGSRDKSEASQPSPGNFVPRTDIRLQLQNNPRLKDLNLHWIDVGTWEIPAEVISDRHREAWAMTYENALLNKEVLMKRAFKLAYLAELLRLVQEMPVQSFDVLQTQAASARELVQALLAAFQARLLEALSSLEQDIFILEGELQRPTRPEKEIQADLKKARELAEDIRSVLEFLARQGLTAQWI